MWYSSPYCTPEAEAARGNEDSWSSVNDGEEEKKKTRVWVSVEPGTDSWALGVLTYAMLTGSHPWAETTGDCRSYLKYQEWFDRVKGPEEELDGPEEGEKDLLPVAPQFACFTPLACSLFLSLLHPRAELRGQPEDALSYLGGDWMMEQERERLEEERKKSRGKADLRSLKEMEGRGER